MSAIWGTHLEDLPLTDMELEEECFDETEWRRTTLKEELEEYEELENCPICRRDVNAKLTKWLTEHPQTSEKQAMKELKLIRPKPRLTMFQLVALYIIIIGLSLTGVMLIWS